MTHETYPEPTRCLPGLSHESGSHSYYESGSHSDDESCSDSGDESGSHSDYESGSDSDNESSSHSDYESGLHTYYESTLTPHKVYSLTRPVKSLCPLNDTNVRVEKPRVVNAPAIQSFRSLFPDLFHDFATPVISPRHSKFTYNGIGDNHKHADVVSQS